MLSLQLEGALLADKAEGLQGPFIRGSAITSKTISISSVSHPALVAPLWLTVRWLSHATRAANFPHWSVGKRAPLLQNPKQSSRNVPDWTDLGHTAPKQWEGQGSGWW